MFRTTRALIVATVLALSMGLTPVVSAAPHEATELFGGRAVPVSDTGSYVVLMEGDPLVVTQGRDAIDSPSGRERGRQMRQTHSRAARDAGVRIVNQYTVALNGFSASMSHRQATELASRDDVTMVVPDVRRHATTDSSPEFMGLSGSGGAWDLGVTGDGVVVGVIDTGIWPEHPSFADDGTYGPAPSDIPADLPCEFGNTAHNPADTAFECNDKLLGARQMLNTYRSLVGADPGEFDSARDDDGHGTHTASTAAGNAGVPASVEGHDLGEISGIAPRAHVVAYKGLGAQGGFSSDLAAAIDQAVADGVDVINYSIGGGPSLTGVDDIAFLFAADGGVFVATSAGNDGPGDATLGGPASVPWLTSVGASTQTRFWQGTVVLGDGQTFTGASLTGDVPSQTPIVDAAFAFKGRPTDPNRDLCVPGTLKPGVVRNAIVLCRRGAIARVDKSLAVAQAGGVGMIMYENSDDGDRFTDTHHVPSVHVDHTPGLAIKSYIATQPLRKATAAIVDTGVAGTFDAAPSMTSFSSRGPDPVALDLVKPDVTAPGMQILAGASPYADPGGNDFMSIAGTSMSSPHVAGLFALLKQAHPDWSPAAAKSALMTTADADVVSNDRTTPATPFEMGAGHVTPGSPAAAGSAFDPGLVYDAGFVDYLGFLCEAGPEVFANPAGTCGSLEDQGVPVTATDLNLASIGMSSVPGSKTVTRTVTSVADTTQTYTVSVDSPDGFGATVSPTSIELEPGESASFTVTLNTVDASIGEWRFGSLTWSSGTYSATSPIAARASQLQAPDEVSASGESGSIDFDVTFGYTGAYSAGDHGLVPATVFADDVAQDPDQTFSPGDVGNGAVAHDITTSGAALLRIVIPPDGVVDPAIDIDVFVHDSAGNLVGSSTNGGTDEQVDLHLPADDTYTVYIHGWQTVTPSTPVTTYAWVLSADRLADDATLTAAGPVAATIGTTGTVTASWSGADTGQWHLGAVSHNDASGLLQLTVVDLDNR